MLFYWHFKPADDGSSRIDLLVENADRQQVDPTPEIIFAQIRDPETGDFGALQSVRSDTLIAAGGP